MTNLLEKTLKLMHTDYAKANAISLALRTSTVTGDKSYEPSIEQIKFAADQFESQNGPESADLSTLKKYTGQKLEGHTCKREKPEDLSEYEPGVLSERLKTLGKRAYRDGNLRAAIGYCMNRNHSFSYKIAEEYATTLGDDKLANRIRKKGIILAELEAEFSTMAAFQKREGNTEYAETLNKFTKEVVMNGLIF